MRLDHVSYVASHDQISDVVNRIGSQIGTAFVDGGIHPKFGTRNFTAPLLNGQYIEVVCPIEHPSTDSSPFGELVRKKVSSGGGWMSWTFSVSSLDLIENELGRKANHGQRKKPNGDLIAWDQIGVLSSSVNPTFPYFIKWKSQEHPSEEGVAIARIKSIHLTGEKIVMQPWVRAVDSLTRDKIDAIWSMNNFNEPIIEKINFTLGINEIEVY